MRHLQRYEWTYEIWLKEDIAELLLGPLFSTTDAFARVVKVLVKHKSSLRSVKKVLDNCVIKWGHTSDDFEARANQKHS